MLDFDRTIVLHLDFTVLTVIVMLMFALIASRRGWRSALVTLVGLFFAWGVAVRTTDFLVRVIRFFSGLDFSGDQRGFFTLLLYVSSVVMVVYTFNSIIGPGIADRRDKITGSTVGLLNGYFFMLLLLDVARDWISTHITDWTLTLNAGYAFELDPGRITVITEFTNNAVELYGQLLTVQNIVLLLLLLLFWHGLIFGLLTGIDRRLRPARK